MGNSQEVSSGDKLISEETLGRNPTSLYAD